MKCRFVRKIFKNEDNGYCVFVYQTEGNDVPDAAKSAYYKGKGSEFTAVGSQLPATDSVEVELHGKWSKEKYGLQLLVESYEEILPQTLEGIKAYLASGMVKGIGPKTAELITDHFGVRTFEVMDDEPEKLLKIKGISEKKLKNILTSYQGNHAMRDLAAYLTPYKISIRKIQKIYEEYGKASLDTVRNNPFSLCRISGFGFLTVDGIARANRCRLNDPMRIEGCIGYCMDKEMQDGHLFVNKDVFLDMIHKTLNDGFDQEVASVREINTVIYRLSQSRQLFVDQGAVYTAKNHQNEKETAEIIARILTDNEAEGIKYDLLITEAQKKLGILLSEKQAMSIQMVFSNKLSIITGGPGTGKTTIQKVLLYVYEQLGGERAMLMAPTGRASRRMAESTGVDEASTMHSALGLAGDYTDTLMESEALDADFIILDEQSMVDMHLAATFFRHVEEGVRVVLIGDINQLPSVGPGNVFREMIQSGVIPVTELDMIFRQGKNSRISSNAHKMQKNDACLEYGSDFVFLPAASDKDAAEHIERVFMDEVQRVGLENVQILTPYRKRGAASVNELNAVLREKINPQEVDADLHKKCNNTKSEMNVGGQIFRIGDKVIQNRNKGEISNGDIGFIQDIILDGDDIELAKIQFSDGRYVDYSATEMEMIEHSYATTIHKSQGSEYQVVIMPWIPMFYKMLKRNIFYTGITRAQTKVYIIGSKRSITQAIHSLQDDKRSTRLGERIIRSYHDIIGEKHTEETGYCQTAMNL